MNNITIIAAIGKNRELGKNNDLIWHLSEDLKFFKEHTIGKDIVMGSNTLKSLPRKLKDRHYVILTSRNMDADEDWTVVHSVDELLEYISSKEEEVMIIGGASIYQQMMPYANRMLLTEVDAEDRDADAYFPDFSKDEWDSKVLCEHDEEEISYKHLEYIKK
ncbi:MAG: dihydrofolate reductase [Bacilli bacterium]|nr:dihydrofolate reductase [Bacilli bacterium]